MADTAVRPPRGESTPARDHCLAPRRSADHEGARRDYGRLFPDLPPLRYGEDQFQRHGRAAVAGENDTFVAADDGGPGSDAAGPAGWPIFAQFVAHDLTADRSGLASIVDVADLENARGPRLNLECLYGTGPSDRPYLYEREDPAKLLLGRTDGGRAEDLPRNAEGVALLGDPRNDVHTLISQLHVAFIKLHNLLVDRARDGGVPEPACFAHAQRELRWHFQWVVLNDFLPAVAGEAQAAEVRDGGRRLFRPTDAPFVPVEFADAAFRYGHSQIRERYRLNASMEPATLFPGLMGFAAVPDRHLADWRLLFDLPGAPPAPQRAKRIDGRLVPSLIRLPAQITGDLNAPEHQSLAVRDLQRGVGTGLPSGEAVARHLGERVLTADEVGVAHLGWEAETPLWYYVLKEAGALHAGDRLGPVGGRIVTEVLVGMVDLDPTSYRRIAPDWRPQLGGSLGALLARVGG